MFTKETVFVLGAGVSKPFKFPVGMEMKDAICNPKKIDSGLMTELLSLCLAYNETGELDPLADCRSNNVEQFINAFRRADMYSIDNWLEMNHRDETLLRVAKCAIAAIILDAETHATIEGAKAEEDWYASLWNYMVTPKIEDLASNRVSFITFNYDRLFEWKLKQQIENTYLGASTAQHKSAFEAFRKKIVHVHGALNISDSDADLLKNYGEISFRQPDGVLQNIRDNWKRRFAYCTQAAARAINIVCENPNKDNPLVEQAKALITKDARVVLLGFSYDKRNVIKLGLDSHAKQLGSTGKGTLEQALDTYRIVGTAMGIKRGERSIVETMFHGRIALAPETMDAVEFCRNSVYGH